DLEGNGRNAIGLVDGYLVFGRVDGTLGVMPFDQGHPQSLASAISVVSDKPHSRNSGVQAALSNAGDLVYVKATNRSRIVFIDDQGRVTRTTSDDHNLVGPRVSPDGRRVVAADVSDDANTADLWMFDTRSSVLERLTTDGHSNSPSWTPDGKSILYTHW